METNDTAAYDEIDLLELLRVLRKRMWVIILVGVLTAACVGAYSRFIVTPQYTSSTQIYILGKEASITSMSLSDLQLGSQLTNDYMIMIVSRPVLEQVIENLGLPMDYVELEKLIEVTNPTSTRILEISATYPDAYMVKEIVDEIAEVSSEQIAVIMDMPKPNIIEDGVVPKVQSSPSVLRNTAIGGMLGVVVMCIIFCAMYLLNNMINGKEDVEKYLGLSTLGVIPDEDFYNTKKGKKNGKGKNGKNESKHGNGGSENSKAS